MHVSGSSGDDDDDDELKLRLKKRIDAAKKSRASDSGGGGDDAAKPESPRKLSLKERRASEKAAPGNPQGNPPNCPGNHGLKQCVCMCARVFSFALQRRAQCASTHYAQPTSHLSVACISLACLLACLLACSLARLRACARSVRAPERYNTPNDNMTCSACASKMGKGNPFFGCKACKHTLCASCYRGGASGGGGAAPSGGKERPASSFFGASFEEEGGQKGAIDCSGGEPAGVVGRLLSLLLRKNREKHRSSILPVARFLFLCSVFCSCGRPRLKDVQRAERQHQVRQVRKRAEEGSTVPRLQGMQGAHLRSLLPQVRRCAAPPCGTIVFVGCAASAVAPCGRPHRAI